MSFLIYKLLMDCVICRYSVFYWCCFSYVDFVQIMIVVMLLLYCLSTPYYGVRCAVLVMCSVSEVMYLKFLLHGTVRRSMEK
jgi:hypothetical protein